MNIIPFLSPSKQTIKSDGGLGDAWHREKLKEECSRQREQLLQNVEERLQVRFDQEPPRGLPRLTPPRGGRKDQRAGLQQPGMGTHTLRSLTSSVSNPGSALVFPETLGNRNLSILTCREDPKRASRPT